MELVATLLARLPPNFGITRVRIIHFHFKVDIQKPGKGSSKFISIQLSRHLNIKTGLIAIIHHQGQQPIGRTGILPGSVSCLFLLHNSKAGPLTFLDRVGSSNRVGNVIVHVGGVDRRINRHISAPALPGSGATTGDAAHETGDTSSEQRLLLSPSVPSLLPSPPSPPPSATSAYTFGALATITTSRSAIINISINKTITSVIVSGFIADADRQRQQLQQLLGMN
eukprot:11890608-Ditylum_brightwellii.AAC.1